MIKLTEKELVEIVKDVTLQLLNQPKLYDTWGTHSSPCITEGLIYSYSPNKLIKIIKSHFNLTDIGATLMCTPRSCCDIKDLINIMSSKENKLVDDYDVLIEFNIIFNNGIKTDLNTIKQIIKLLKSCGWEYMCIIHQGAMIEKNITEDLINQLSNTPCHIKFEPNFSQKIPKNMLPPLLYHIAPSRVSNKIQKQGLTPRNNGRIVAHTQRVYLFLNKPTNWKEIANVFRESGKDEPYMLLSIDVSKINQSINFHQDTNTMKDNPAVYTFEPIPPSAISIVDTE